MSTERLEFDKDLYDKIVGKLKEEYDRINTFSDSYLTAGENVLQGAQQFQGIFDDIKLIVQEYSWVLDDVIIKMESASETLAQVDQLMSTDIVGMI